MAFGTFRFYLPVTVQFYLDNFLRKCYLVDNESFETELFFEAFDFHSVMLENANNSFLDLNHCNTQCYAFILRK